jgi:hypothetical protein
VAEAPAYIGHYGCGRVIKVRTPPGVKPRIYGRQEKFEVKCPGCGWKHTIRVLWRRAKRGELSRAEITVKPSGLADPIAGGKG